MLVVEIHPKHLGCRTSTDLWLTKMGQRSENGGKSQTWRFRLPLHSALIVFTTKLYALLVIHNAQE